MSEERLDGSLFGPGQPCFGCSPQHAFGFRLTFTREGDEVVTRFTPDERYQGPPGIMHGGLVATLADEVGAWTLVGLVGKFGFTGELKIRLKKAVRTGEPLVARGRIIRDAKRIVDVEVVIEQGSVTAVTGELRFVVMDAAGAERMLGRPLPEIWQRFQR